MLLTKIEGMSTLNGSREDRRESIGNDRPDEVYRDHTWIVEQYQ